MQGNVHANGDITGGGSLDISGDVTATGTVDDDIDPDGLKAGGMPPITVPEIKASDFLNLADYILTSTGGCQSSQRNHGCALQRQERPELLPGRLDFQRRHVERIGLDAVANQATYYVEGTVEMHGTGKSSGFTQLSLIAEGSIKITGNGKFKPENGANIQFVTNGDFELGGTADADDPIDMDGQIMVREQIKIYGNSEFQGRVMVENRDSATNVYDAVTNPNGRKGGSTLNANSLTGNMTVTYNGSSATSSPRSRFPEAPSTYTNNISGWIEQ